MSEKYSSKTFIGYLGLILGIVIMLIMVPEIQNFQPVEDIDSNYQYIHDSSNMSNHNFDFYRINNSQLEYNLSDTNLVIGGSPESFYPYANNVTYFEDLGIYTNLKTYNLPSSSVIYTTFDTYSLINTSTIQILGSDSTKKRYRIYQDENPILNVSEATLVEEFYFDETLLEINGAYTAFTMSELNIFEIEIYNTTHCNIKLFNASNSEILLTLTEIEMNVEINTSQYLSMYCYSYYIANETRLGFLGMDTSLNSQYYNMSISDLILKSVSVNSYSSYQSFSSIHGVNAFLFNVTGTNSTGKTYFQVDIVDSFYNITENTDEIDNTPFNVTINSIAEYDFYLNFTIVIDYEYQSDLTEIGMSIFIPLIIIGLIVIVILGYTKFDEAIIFKKR